MVCNHFIRISKETKEMLQECREEFFRSNPKLKGIRVTEDYLVKRTFLYYLGRSEKL